MRTGSVLRTLLLLTLAWASSSSPGVFEAHAQAAEASGQTGVVRVQSPRPGSMVYIDNEIVVMAYNNENGFDTANLLLSAMDSASIDDMDAFRAAPP